MSLLAAFGSQGEKRNYKQFPVGISTVVSCKEKANSADFNSVI